MVCVQCVMGLLLPHSKNRFPSPSAMTLIEMCLITASLAACASAHRNARVQAHLLVSLTSRCAYCVAAAGSIAVHDSISHDQPVSTVVLPL
jgi:hypothetical protein